MFGNKVFIDLEIALPGELSLNETHGISEHIREEVEQNFLEVKYIMIHVNPV